MHFSTDNKCQNIAISFFKH